MPYVQAGNIRLHYQEYGHGDNIIIFIHGNLACLNWMDLVLPKLPDEFHVFAFDWRGCGDSEKPEPAADYSNYSIAQHAEDMILAIKSLGIKKCNIANHSTGGIITTYMLLNEPDMFGKIFCLDPVGPMGLDLGGRIENFWIMKENRAATYFALATAASTLFDPESFITGILRFCNHTTIEQKLLFDMLIDKAMTVSDGIWFGTPFHLRKEKQSGYLRSYQGKIKHQHLILWGEYDRWIPKADMEEMAEKMPNARLIIIPGVSHSMNIEAPDKFARMFRDYFSQH